MGFADEAVGGLMTGERLRGLLAPFDEAAGYIYTAQTDGEQIVVHYPWPVDLCTSSIAASGFVSAARSR